ncbi:MAG: hypothetical protein IJZ26_02085 [Clostridia bacterium]|nr:hypothetical protein [Clostridia bacterium]
MNEKLGMEKNLEYSAYLLYKNQFLLDYFKTHYFLKNFKKKYAKENNIPYNKLKMKFINFGYYSTIYVLKNDNNYKTVLVGSPYLEFGRMKKEADLLKHFNKIENSVVAPVSFFAEDKLAYKRELFVTPYFYQARAVSNLDGKFGIYIPEPEYRFEESSKEQTMAMKTCIIAKLISSFDDKNNLGISDVQIISGDFIMEKEWEKLEPTLQNTYDNMKLISARDCINCSLDEYIDLIKKEFTKSTSSKLYKYKANTNYKLNTCSDIVFTSKEIEDGINLGMEKRQQRVNKEQFLTM